MKFLRKIMKNKKSKKLPKDSDYEFLQELCLIQNEEILSLKKELKALRKHREKMNREVYIQNAPKSSKSTPQLKYCQKPILERSFSCIV